MTQPIPPWPQHAALLLRLVYQRAKVLGGLRDLTPRALTDLEIVPGRSEFAVVDSDDLNQGGWDGDLLVIPRQYVGYVAVHYPSTTDQRETFEDEARVMAALTTYGQDPRVTVVPGFNGMGTVPGRWFLNDRPAKVAQTPVLTLEFTWTLGVNLLIPRAFTEGAAP